MGDGQGTRYSSGAAKRPVAVAGRRGWLHRADRAHPAHGAQRAQPLRSKGGRRGALYHNGPEPLPWLAAGTAITGLAVLIWRRFARVEVSGLSMMPTLQPGDRLVVWRTWSVRPGDIVAAADPRQPERAILKRVASVDPDGIFLMGDNPGQSTDSRQFGRVPIKSLLGRALYRYAPPARAGRLCALNGGRVLETDFTREMETAGWTVSVWANGPGDTYATHAHSYKKMLCCLEGSIVFHTGTGDITLNEGDRMVLEPGTPHSATVGQEGVRCAEAHAPS